MHRRKKHKSLQRTFKAEISISKFSVTKGRDAFAEILKELNRAQITSEVMRLPAESSESTVTMPVVITHVHDEACMLKCFSLKRYLSLKVFAHKVFNFEIALGWATQSIEALYKEFLGERFEAKLKAAREAHSAEIKERYLTVQALLQTGTGMSESGQAELERNICLKR